MEKDVGHALHVHIEGGRRSPRARRLKHSFTRTKGGGLHLQGPDRRVIGRAEFAGNSVQAVGLKRSAGGNAQAGRQLSLLRMEVALDNRHGRHWTDVMWKEALEQS